MVSFKHATFYLALYSLLIYKFIENTAGVERLKRRPPVHNLLFFLSVQTAILHCIKCNLFNEIRSSRQMLVQYGYCDAFILIKC